MKEPIKNQRKPLGERSKYQIDRPILQTENSSRLKQKWTTKIGYAEKSSNFFGWTGQVFSHRPVDGESFERIRPTRNTKVKQKVHTNLQYRLNGSLSTSSFLLDTEAACETHRPASPSLIYAVVDPQVERAFEFFSFSNLSTTRQGETAALCGSSVPPSLLSSLSVEREGLAEWEFWTWRCSLISKTAF